MTSLFRSLARRRLLGLAAVVAMVAISVSACLPPPPPGDNSNPPYRASATNQLGYGAKAVLTRYYVPLVTWRVGGFTVALFVRPPTA